MEYGVLGPIVAGDDPAGGHIRSRNQRVVLAVLLARRPTVVSVDSLVDAVWDDDPPPSAVSTLRTYVSRLRHTVRDDLVAVGPGYRLAPVDGSVDADRFEQLLQRASTSPPAKSGRLLDEALGLWRGAAFGDLADHPAVLAVARRLEELRVTAGEERARVAALAGDRGAAIAMLEALLAEHRLRESAWTLLVDSLVDADRAADALRAAQRARAALADAGLEPSPTLAAAERRALGTEPPPAALPDAVAPVDHAPVDRAAHDQLLPTPITALVGRDAELGTVVDLLGEARVVTLVGPGGVGKTRLSLEAAAVAGHRHTMGSRLVELGAVDDSLASGRPDVVAAMVAGAVGIVPDGRAPLDAVAAIGSLDVLVVLDNAEHLLGSVAHVAERIASGGTAARLLVTSRERLGVDGEHVCTIAPLDVEGAGSAAHRLFVERARAVIGGGAPLDPVLVDRIVRRVDGLPLVIEMAAARLSSTSLAELADELDASSAGLRSPRRSVAARHRSAEELLGWSTDHLDDDEVRVLRSLNVFAGQFSAIDVDGVLGPGHRPVLRRLVDRSLVTATLRDDRMWFGLLQLVSDHVVLRFGDPPAALAAAHARWYAAAASECAARLVTQEEPAARHRLVGMLDELRAAHRWAAEHDRATALSISAALHRFAYAAVHDEVLSWAERLVAGGRRPDDDAADFAVTAASAAVRAITCGDHAGGATLARRAVADAPDDESALPALEALGDATLYDGLLDESRAAYAELERRGRRAGDRSYVAVGAVGVALVSVYAGTPVSPLPDDDPTLPPTVRAWAAYGRGEVLSGPEPDAAASALDEALRLARMVPSPIIEGVSLVSLASLRARSDDPRSALGAFRDAIRLWRELADRTHQVTTLRNLVDLLRRLDRPVDAAVILGSLDVTDVGTYGVEAERLAAVERWLTERLGAADADLHRQVGHALDVTAAADRAIGAIDAIDPLS